jgi:hypothetical protein
MDRKDVMRTNV